MDLKELALLRTMKLFIPTIGDVLSVTEPWPFTFHQGGINYRIFEELFELGEGRPKPAAGDIIQAYRRLDSRQFDLLLRMGTLLKVDRVYIRQNRSNYDSLTFRILGRTHCRFWAELKDVNHMRVEVVSPEQVEQRVSDWKELRTRQACEAATQLSPVPFDS